MSSNIQVQRICQHCQKEFTARTTVTRFCSDVCSKRANKAKTTASKIERSNQETSKHKVVSIEVLKAKEFLTVKDVATLLNCSVRSVYYYIDSKKLHAVNLSQRITRVRRSDLDKLFEQLQFETPQTKSEPILTQSDIPDCYNLTEVQTKYNISEKALHDLIKRNNIPKLKKGWYAYVPKTIIDKLLN